MEKPEKRQGSSGRHPREVVKSEDYGEIGEMTRLFALDSTPGKWRDETEYRTTLAHKVNHKFKRNNAFFQTVHHPVLGALGCIVAKNEIDVGAEIYVNYEYNVDVAPQWYRDGYDQVYGYEDTWIG